MEIFIIVLACLAAGLLVLAWYKDWLGLWVTKESMRARLERAKDPTGLLGPSAGSEAGEGPAAGQGKSTGSAGRAVAFDVDPASLCSLREALPNWEIELVNGATAASLSRDWRHGAVGLLVVGLREKSAESLGLCRFLAFRNSCAPGLGDTAGRVAPLLVLTPPGQGLLVEEALDAVAHRCLSLPIQAVEVAGLMKTGRESKQPAHRSPSANTARDVDLWRDDGGQG